MSIREMGKFGEGGIGSDKFKILCARAEGGKFWWIIWVGGAKFGGCAVNIADRRMHDGAMC